MLIVAVALESEVHMHMMLPEIWSPGMWRATVALESSTCPRADGKGSPSSRVVEYVAVPSGVGVTRCI